MWFCFKIINLIPNINQNPKAIEIFSWKILNFWWNFWCHACDQKLLLVNFYVKSYLSTGKGPWGADLGLWCKLFITVTELTTPEDFLKDGLCLLLFKVEFVGGKLRWVITSSSDDDIGLAVLKSLFGDSTWLLSSCPFSVSASRLLEFYKIVINILTNYL